MGGLGGFIKPLRDWVPLPGGTGGTGGIAEGQCPGLWGRETWAARKQNPIQLEGKRERRNS